MSTTAVENFKGRSIICIKRTEDDRYPFSFGLGKARLILEHIAEIEQFVKETETTQTAQPQERTLL